MIRKRQIILQVLVLFQLNGVCHSQVNHENGVPDALRILADKIHSAQDLVGQLSSYIELQSILGQDLNSVISGVLSILENQFLQQEHVNETQCVKDLTYLVVNTLAGEYWALSMLDASAKLPQGIMEGNVYWVGSVTECRRIRVQRKTTNGGNGELSGKYCSAVVEQNTKVITNVNTPSLPLFFRIDICVPDSCSTDDLKFVFNGVNKLVGLSDVIIISELSCFLKDNSLWKDKEAVVCFIIVCLFIVLVIMGSIYDVFYHRRNFPTVKYSSSMNNGVKKLSDSQSLSETVDLLEDDEYNNGDDSFNNNKDDKLEKYSCEKLPTGIGGKILLSFSAYTNAGKILNLSTGVECLQCLNGIRFLSMVWIIVGHTCLFLIIFVENRTFIFDAMKTFEYQLSTQAFFAVDSFFILSGLLVAYFFCKQYEDKKGKISWSTFYFYRIWRLTPVYLLFLFLFEKNLSYYITDSPIWNYTRFFKNNCDKAWWWNVLYVNNFTPIKDQCMIHSWYLANEMQFYILSPLVLIPLVKRWVRISVIITGIFILISIISSGVISYYYNIPAVINFMQMLLFSDDYNKFFDLLYDKPYCRIGPYIFGMICGWFLQTTKCKVKLKKGWVILGWILAFGCTFSVVFGLYRAHPSPVVSSLYMALARMSWSLGLIWLIFACCNGYGGIINSILSWPVWSPFSRLTYSAFLVQVMVIKTTFFGAEHMDYFSYLIMFQHFFAFISICYLVGFLISLVFESPFMAMEAFIFKRR